MTSPAKCSESEKYCSITAGKVLTQVDPGEELVISGLAGCYPDSYDVNHFRENLFNKKDLISGDDRRWSLEHPEIPKRGGRIFDLEKFDPSPFGIHHKQTIAMDPMCRKLLEKTFEALFDAGIHPSEIKGTRTGVYVGLCFSESEKTWIYEKLHSSGCGVTGCMRSMLANRISYYLGVNGPSYIVDTACSSSMYAIEQAYRAIRMGECDMAIVGGSNICIHPFVTVQFARLGVLNKDGNCKCFDNNADGYTRAEAIVVVILQKSKDARRIYCHFVHAKTNCDGYKEFGITYPSGALQTELLNEFYEECNVNPIDVPYIEAHGTGTKVGDPEELSAIQTVFCPEERKNVLMIGSVKSNIGHTEPVSGLCSITKVILNMESGYLIPNINYKTPKEGISALQDGRIKVVTDAMKWKVGYSAVSSFGFGGGNCHVLLKANPKEKINHGLPNDDIPRLVYLSGRNKETINNILNEIASKPMDAELIGLLHEIFKYNIEAFNYRGYGLFTKNGLISRELDYNSYDQKPLWFVLTGLGNQWHEMAADLMKIPMFAGTIEKCHEILSAKGVCLADLITKADPSMFEKQANTFVAITSIQIALIELLKYIDVKPAGVIGYSIGEIACGYFDGCLTLEQALLCSYYLGQASDKCKKGRGSMIYIESGHKKVQELLTPGLEIVGRISERNTVVSGPNMKIQEFIEKLKENCITFEEINTSLAFHSSYVKEIATSVIKYLKPIVPKAKKRSDKWISTLDDKNNTNLCSATFLSTILVTHINVVDNYKKVPQNAITFEISPDGQLKKYLKQSILDKRINISLMEKNNNTLQTLLIAIGKLYIEGFNPKIERIYPKVSFPVSRTTPMLSSLVKWNHSQDWFVTKVEVQDKVKSGERSIQVLLNNEEFDHIAGHVIDGRVLFPATGYITLVWQSVGVLVGHVHTEISVIFEDVKYHRATHITKDSRINFIIMIHRVSGIFEITEGGAAIVTGRVSIANNVKNEVLKLPRPVPEEKDYYVPLNSRDIYKELRLRGYNYTGLYRGFKSCDTTATIGEIAWKKNWVAFMDTILQMQILQVDTRGLFVPTAIKKLIIDIEKHNEITDSLDEDGSIPAYVYKHIKTIVCGGVEIHDLQASVIARKKNLGVPVIETYKFIPNNIQKTNLSLAQSVRILLHIIMENCLTGKIKTTEVLEDDVVDDSNILSPIIIDALGDIPLVQPEAYLITSNPLQVNGATISDKKLIAETNCVIVIATNILKKPQTLQVALNAVINGGFIICREDLDFNLSEINLNKVNILADHKLNSERLILLSKRSDSNTKTYINITDPKNNFTWLPTLQESLKNDTNVCIYSQGDEFSGIIGFINCLMREPSTNKVSCVFIMDKDAPTFDPNNPFYANQLDKQTRINILKNGQWGTYRHLLMDAVKEIEVEHAYVNVTVRGDLSSLRWLQGGLSSDTLKQEDNPLVHVYYSAMNFRDIMTASGRIAAEVVASGRFEQDCVQGLEYAGRLDNGQRVAGMVSHLATATLVEADPDLMWSVPDYWSLEEAVTVPVVYGTVLFSVMEQGKMKPGMSILIHSGTGGVGQAAINIALYYNCTVYTTVGSAQKRDFIKKHWPQIKDTQIGYSRDVSFEQMIMRETNGRGVDIILNSLAEEKLQATARCLAKGGKFLEIGKFDIAKDNPLSTILFENGQSFHGIMLDMFTVNKFKVLLKHLLLTHFANGAIKPLQRTVFTENEIEPMFRYMATGKHMGKVVLKIRDEEPELITKPALRLVKAVPRYFATKTYTYIIIGGLGGFGLELADWLIIRGVRKIVLNTRRGITTGYQAYRIKTWESYGVQVVISKADITTYEGCETILEEASKLGPIEGIFNLGVVLKDAIFSNQTVENFITSFGAKATATKYLDELSREYCPHLKQFVVFSSVSCGRGNPGQSNYGMSNSVMERICEKRRNEGYPALAVEWGAVGDVGLVAELQEDRTDFAIGGTLQQRISNCLSVLDQFLQQNEPICASMLVAEKRAGSGSALNVLDAALNILGISDIKTISVNSTLAEQGMDSIMAVEIKQTLESDFEVFLTPQDIRSLTFARLQELAAEQDAKTESSSSLETNKKNLTFNDLEMQNIQRAIGDEEYSNKPFIILPSNALPSCKEKVLLIPGIEGMGSVLKNLASHLTAQAICLQLGFTDYSHNTTITDMAKSLLDRTLAHLPDLKTNGFTIVGYSFGVFITLELAALLEARGGIGRLVLIDGSPTMLKTITKEIITVDVEEEIQNNVLASIIHTTASGELAKKILNVYVKCHTWESKLDAVLSYVEPNEKYSLNHFRNVCDSIYMRLKAVINYESNIGKLKSKILLIRPTQHSIFTDIEDFGLSEFSDKPVSVQYVNGNHVTIIDNPECSQEINKLLVKDVILDKESIFTKTESVKPELVSI